MRDTQGSVGRSQKDEKHSRWLMEGDNRDLQLGRVGLNGFEQRASITRAREVQKFELAGGNKWKMLRKDQPETIQTHNKVLGCWRGREENSCSPQRA